MELDGFREPLVQKAGDSLPKYLDQDNPPEVSARPLGNQDDCLSCALLGQRPITERCLHYGDKILTVGGVRCVVPCGLMQPLAEVFRSVSRWVLLPLGFLFMVKAEAAS